METAPISTQALPTGTRIEEFVIELVLGSGGFGITYLARDARLGRQVVIKENLPVQFCFRDTHSLTVALRHTHGEDAENFRWSLENFSKEAAMLASLDHPGIVRVLRSFEAFGTAYFVMPFVEGITLEDLLKERQEAGQVFSEDELHEMLERILDALAHLHDRGIYHRDIKPGNILITNDGLPVLIDFGSARQRLSERSMTVVESAGYTPFEQLQSRGNVGPWSDLYAFAGTLCKALTGAAPPKANDRMRNDPHVPLAQREPLAARFSKGFLASIDQALAVEETERWQDSGQWLADLRTRAAVVEPLSDPERSQRPHTPETPALPQISSSIPGTKAAKAPSFVNSLGMKFVPVKITGGPSSDQQVLFSIWETRVQDYRKYVTTKSGVNDEWKSPGFDQGEDHPVTNVNWEDAVAFCEWLTEKERDTGTITAHQNYRLPTDHEWSCAVGIGERENAASSPKSKDDQLGDVYPWGTQWPPPKGFGNYAASLKVDSYEYTSPVGSFPANANDIYDLGGNAWEWCKDLYISNDTARVLRGVSWYGGDRVSLRSAYRNGDDPRNRNDRYGFRVVLVGGGG